ncbi:MAG: radical SAM protein [Clostridia bacterium]|nr:radical SAM protein [Clostridia bacterium]
MKISPYLKVNRIEFVVTNHCTGKCRHCSAAEDLNKGHPIRPESALRALKELSDVFNISSVMTFGGEPLLCAETAAAIHGLASECGIPKRQLITNGFFSRNEDQIAKTAKRLIDAGVNDILVSVDVFHAEHIPLGPVKYFAQCVKALSPDTVRLQPAWVVDRNHKNTFNEKTEEILKSFADLGIPENEGNNIFLSGNARKNLSEFYPEVKPDLDEPCGSAPYTDPLTDMKTLSISPDGGVWACAFRIGNIYNEDIETVLERYDPLSDPKMSALLSGGVRGMIQQARTEGRCPDISDCRTACEICRKLNR